MSNITFTLVDGELPPGVSLNPDGSLRGLIDFDVKPTWVTPSGNLYDANVGDTIELDPLEAEPSPGYDLLAFSLVGESEFKKGLPWGLRLNYQTGVISGTVLPLRVPEGTQWFSDEIPIWSTPSESLGTFYTTDEVNLSIEATPQLGDSIETYHIIRGWLPFGLRLDCETGTISGNIARRAAPIEIEELEPKPIWKGSTDLGTHDTGDDLSLQIEAESQLDGDVIYTVKSGILPFGMKLNPLTGEIFGTLSRDIRGNNPLVPKYPIPVWGSSSDLGTYSVLDEVNTAVEATPQIGETVIYDVIGGIMPWGLRLDASTGEITGTISEVNEEGTYSFQISARDGFAVNTMSFSITIEG